MQSPSTVWLWLGPYLLLILFMVYAMMEFTASLLMKGPTQKRQPLTAAQLHARLLELEEKAPPDVQIESSEHELDFYWLTSSETFRRFVISKASSAQHIHIALDEERHELRVCESASSSFFFVGIVRWLPRISAFAGYSAGPPGPTDFIQRLTKVTQASGWTFRPVIFPFQATWRNIRLVRRFTPAFLHQVPLPLFWGILYPLSYCLALIWIFVMGGAEIRTLRNYLLVILISVVWWGLWGLITWLLCGSPRFWRHHK